MKLDIDFDQVRVIQSDNYKGNSTVRIEIFGVTVKEFYAGELAGSDHFLHYARDGVVDTDDLSRLVRWALARHFTKVLIDEEPELMALEDIEFDRGADYRKPRIEVDPSE